jgi:hypothetical protein
MPLAWTWRPISFNHIDAQNAGGNMSDVSTKAPRREVPKTTALSRQHPLRWVAIAEDTL